MSLIFNINCILSIHSLEKKNANSIGSGDILLNYVQYKIHET